MVTMIASYLFDKPTHLIDTYNRKGDGGRWRDHDTYPPELLDR
jgi:hypothetical protein